MDLRPIGSSTHPGQEASNPTAAPSFSPTLSLDKIRSIRHAFEEENEPLRQFLGKSEHQTLMETMYDTTEHFLHKRINDFDVVEHLEFLKITSQELHQRKLSPDLFRSELQRESQNSVFKILQRG